MKSAKGAVACDGHLARDGDAGQSLAVRVVRLRKQTTFGNGGATWPKQWMPTVATRADDPEEL